MSETEDAGTALVPVTPAVPVDPRPWHGSDSPFEALHDWAKAEFERLEKLIPGKKGKSTEADASSE